MTEQESTLEDYSPYQRSKDYQQKIEKEILRLGQKAQSILSKDEFSPLWSLLTSEESVLLVTTLTIRFFRDKSNFWQKEDLLLKEASTQTSQRSNFRAWIKNLILRAAQQKIAFEKKFHEDVLKDLEDKKKDLAFKFYTQLTEEERIFKLRSFELCANQIFSITTSDLSDLKEGEMDEELAKTAEFWKEKILS